MQVHEESMIPHQKHQPIITHSQYFILRSQTFITIHLCDKFKIEKGSIGTEKEYNEMSWDEYDYSKININNNGSKHVKLVYCAYIQDDILYLDYRAKQMKVHTGISIEI